MRQGQLLSWQELLWREVKVRVSYSFPLEPHLNWDCTAGLVCAILHLQLCLLCLSDHDYDLLFWLPGLPSDLPLHCSLAGWALDYVWCDTCFWTWSWPWPAALHPCSLLVEPLLPPALLLRSAPSLCSVEKPTSTDLGNFFLSSQYSRCISLSKSFTLTTVCWEKSVICTYVSMTHVNIFHFLLRT